MVSMCIVQLFTLHKEKLHRREKRRKPFLCTCHKKSHLSDAKAHFDKPGSFWIKMWTDESKMKLFGKNKERHEWQMKSAAFKEKQLLPTVKFGGGSMLLWGCVAS